MTDWISNILCSTLAGICASLVSQPLDTIKVIFLENSSD